MQGSQFKCQDIIPKLLSLDYCVYFVCVYSPNLAIVDFSIALQLIFKFTLL